MGSKDIKVATKENRIVTLRPGDTVTFAYQSIFHLGAAGEAEVICELQLENINGVLMTRGPLNVVSQKWNQGKITPSSETEESLESGGIKWRQAT